MYMMRLFIQIIRLQHFGESPLSSYEPAFDWENERSTIFGKRIPETYMAEYAATPIEYILFISISILLYLLSLQICLCL